MYEDQPSQQRLKKLDTSSVLVHESENLCIKMKDHPKVKWTLYLTITSIFIFISFTEVGHLSSVKESIFPSQIQEPYKYVIIFDGGSTGTRIHVFAFQNDSDGVLTLKNEYFQEVKPGLSSFANKPKKAAESVASLLEKAKSFVPSNSWNDTPVALKATAGLRLLPSDVSDSILHEVYELFRQSPFLSDEQSVCILDGEDEGLFAWYTINFLLGRLNEPSHSVASLDLGGGSTQMSFLPISLDTIVYSPTDHVLQTKVQNRTIILYTYSYLGLGLMSARLSILQSEVNTNEYILSSPCIHSAAKINWRNGPNEYTVIGSKDGIYGFDECYVKAVNFLGNTVYQPEEMRRREIYALSYYFDRAVDLGLIGEGGGVITVGDFIEAAKSICKEKVLKNPFLCLDACYISALLHHSLGFDKKKEITLVQQIHGIETSWALGAAFDMLQRHY